jgi:hypothetical protein
MDTKSMTRKEFVRLTFTLIGGAAAACSSSSSPSDGGTGGSNGSGGTTGSGGTGVGAVCADPLPEMQLPDDTMHMHVVTVAASTLDATTAQTITTGPVIDATGTIAPHTHMVPFTTANLATLKGGGSVTVTAMIADGHQHMYLVSCTAASGTGGTAGSGAAGNGAAGNSGAAGA